MSSETAVVLAKIAYLSGDSPWKLLDQVLIPLLELRARAYARLNDALRQSTIVLKSGARQSSSTTHGSENSSEQSMQQQEEQLDDYPVICANCTEDFKVASEGVLAIREVLEKRNGQFGVKQLINLLDRLQSLEQEKLVTVASLHALKRSAAVNTTANVHQLSGDNQSVEQKLVTLSKKLQSVDTDLTDIYDEVREFVADAKE